MNDFYRIYILECLKCIKHQTHYTSLKDKKEDFSLLERRCWWWYLTDIKAKPYFKSNEAKAASWWYLMLLRKVSRYIGLKWMVFTFCLSQVARNNAVKGKQKNTISFLFNFKHWNLVLKESFSFEIQNTIPCGVSSLGFRGHFLLQDRAPPQFVLNRFLL